MNRINYKRFEDLLTPDIVQKLFPQYNGQDYEYRRESVLIFVFPQIWNSTSCGGGIGGASITTALTIVFLSNNRDKAAVFINEKFRYLVNNCSDNFFQDLRDQRLEGTKYKQYERSK